ncbi:hypothetical protein [Streptomyces arenae]|uniref:hypothetical protein n=1 Tax=Streptomyces arenae TaxID=29301 RepID=UPI002658953D|nr:hypothetical protein [Streptomyces arenae]MCG7203685.1 hypothetical protein [Streptomyces arenae]
MIPVPHLPEVHLPPPWSARATRLGRHSQELWTTGQPGGVRIQLERCAVGRFRDAYPVGLHDIEIRADDLADHALGEMLTVLTAALGAADPRCRRLVLAAPAADGPRIAAAETAGFRQVVDVDLGSAELTLLTWEPAWVTRCDPDLDRVPGA